jgi:hypothetical protein
MLVRLFIAFTYPRKTVLKEEVFILAQSKIGCIHCFKIEGSRISWWQKLVAHLMEAKKQKEKEGDGDKIGPSRSRP